jgi:hypothetical protein
MKRPSGDTAGSLSRPEKVSETPRDGKAEPGTFHVRATQLHEVLEDMAEVFRSDPDPAVDYLDDDSPGIVRAVVGPDLYGLPQPVLRRIRDEVEQDLAHALRVGVDSLRHIADQDSQGGAMTLTQRHHRRMQLVEKSAENVTAGQKLADPLRRSGYFPADVVEMITIAEEANSLETVLVNIADGLEKRTARNLDLMVKLLEPIMLLVMAGVTLTIVAGLLLPVFKMGSAVG